jgi:hypothetical protein|tara:strand:+ start:904 stop:1305 length:402 start_codon:yes stop_codon:yes gene_type:complete
MTYELKDYLNAINHEKKNLMDTDDEMWEKKYPAFIVNKCIAPFPDTIHLVNEMNLHNHLDKKLQFDFLLNSIRTRKRFTPWMKASKQKNLEYVKEYYGYNNEKARSALKVLSDEQIKAIKDSLDKGGRNNGKY